jgi:hypothetical protein
MKHEISHLSYIVLDMSSEVDTISSAVEDNETYVK